MLGLIMRSALIDNFIESLNRSKYFHVVCSDPKPICNFIEKNLVRGATIVNAKGSFTGDNKYIILTVLSPSQAVKLRNFITWLMGMLKLLFRARNAMTVPSVMPPTLPTAMAAPTRAQTA